MIHSRTQKTSILALIVASFSSLPLALAQPTDEGPAAEAEASPAPSVAVPVEPVPTRQEYFRDLVAQSGGLTADEAAAEAASYTREATVAQEDLKAADAHRAKTIYDYAPQVTLTASYTRISNAQQGDAFGGTNLVGTTAAAGTPAAPIFAIDGSAFNFSPVPNQYYLNAGVTVPISDYVFNLSQALAGLDASKKSARLNEKAARVNAAASARLAYYDWVRIKLSQGEAEKSLERTREQQKLLQELHAAGRVARADLLRQDAYVAQAELGVRRASTQEAIARENLHVLMTGGNGPTPTWSIGEDIMDERAGDSASLESTERYHQEALQSRLEIQALDSTVYALRQQAKVQRTRGYPRVEGFGNLTYANPNQRFFPQQQVWNGSWDVGVRMVWTLNKMGAAGADARVTQAEVAQVNAKKGQIKDALRSEVVSASRSLEEASLARESAQRGAAAAEASYNDRKRLFENGRATAFDVLDAETALITARLNVVQSYVALRMARVRFDHALGRDVSAVVKAPQPRD